MAFVHGMGKLSRRKRHLIGDGNNDDDQRNRCLVSKIIHGGLFFWTCCIFAVGGRKLALLGRSSFVNYLLCLFQPTGILGDAKAATRSAGHLTRKALCGDGY
jgi:hypothetical protein